MAKNQLISFEISQEWLDIYVSQHGYRDQVTTSRVDEKSGNMIDETTPNPQSKVDFVEEILTRQMEASVMEWKRNELHTQLAASMANEGKKGIVRIKKK